MSELIIIDKGDEVESNTLNFNFQCLDEKIVSTNQRIETVSASIKSVQSTLNSQLTSATDELNQSMEKFETETNAKLDTKLNANEKEKITNMCVPDYSKGRGGSLPFVAPQDGVVYFNILFNNSGANIYINGAFVAYYSDQADGAARDNFTFVLGKGDTLTCSCGVNNFVFFPLKGAV